MLGPRVHFVAGLPFCLEMGLPNCQTPRRRVGVFGHFRGPLLSLLFLLFNQNAEFS